jgi:hypothetical protein
MRQCCDIALLYIKMIQPNDIDKLSLADIANLLVSFNHFTKAERRCSQLSTLYNGMISNGSSRFPKHITTAQIYAINYQKQLCEMRIPMQSAKQLEYFHVWDSWMAAEPIGHIYKFLAKTMHTRSIVALEWCVAKLSQEMRPGGCFKRPVTWMDNVLSRRKQWPNYVNWIKVYAYQWKHPKAIKVARSFTFYEKLTAAAIHQPLVKIFVRPTVRK